MVGRTTIADPEGPPTDQSRFVDRFDPRLLVVLTVLVIAAPIGAYFWFIHQYAFNAVYSDQWTNIELLGYLHSGTLTLGDLWMSHNDHRMLVPNLIVLLLGETTHFDIIAEDYLSGLILAATVGILILAHRRRSPAIPWIYYSPVALVLFSLVQWDNTLWGFQIAWYIITLALAGTIFLLDRPVLTGAALAGAVAVAAVGSFSSLQGLLIWPVGLVLLLQRRRSRNSVIIWVVAALIVAAVYVYHLAPAHYSNHSFVFTHPLSSLEFFVVMIGSVIGWGSIHAVKFPEALILLGAVILAVALWVLVRYGLRRDERSGAPIGVAVTTFGILFAVLIAEGRSWGGLFVPSRYTAPGLLILVGCYLVFLDPAPSRVRPGRSEADLLPAGRPNGTSDRSPDTPPGTPDRAGRSGPAGRSGRSGPAAPTVAWSALLVVIGLQVILGNVFGLGSARTFSDSQKATADVTVNIDKASDALIRNVLFNGILPVQSRQVVQIMKSDRLSLFDTGAPAYYAELGLLPELTEPQTRVLYPGDGATLRGTQLLGASASDMSGLTAVEFRVTGGAVHDRTISTATQDHGLWTGHWNTSDVPDGSYTLTSVASGYGGAIRHSPGITVTVRN